MTKTKIPLFQRILFRLLLPVIVVGILCATLFVFYLSSPQKAFLIRQFDANLRVSSIMGLRICEESFSYLLDLRLEKNPEMNQVMKKETLSKIRAVSGQFPQIHLMVIASGRRIEMSSLDNSPGTWDGPPLDDQDDTILFIHHNGEKARAFVQFFPFWEWHIVSFVFEKDYNIPIRMAYTITYMSAAGVFFAILITLVVVFHLYIRRPLNSLIASTDGVADGSLFKIDKIPRNEFGRLMTSFNGMIDSLENEKAEVRYLIRQLRESEALFRSQFEFGDIGIAVVRPDENTWVKANERLYRMLGYTEEELYRIGWIDVFHKKDLGHQKRLFYRLISEDIGRYEGDFRLIRKNGDLVYTHINVSCIRHEDKSIKYVIASVLDITARKRAEAEKEQLSLQLSQNQKMEAIGTLAGGIAHDFNNILSGIFGYSQLAIEHMGEVQKAEDDIQHIMKGASRAAELVQQILTFSRNQDYEKKYLSLSVVVKEVLKLIRSTIPTTIEIKEQINSHAGILADPTRIHQVIMNLCTNAYHAMSESGGELHVRLCDSTARVGYLELEISDTGHGMDDNTLNKIFEPYFTTKPREKGTGLGLALVHAIVEEHEGFIRVSSRVGKGTCFLVYFPIAERPKKRVDRRQGEDRLPFGKESVMFVDDEDGIRSLTRTYLEKYGYTVAAFENGVEAYEAFQENPGRYDLVITDMAMPKMNGREFTEKILNIRKDIPVIFCTGFSENFNEDQAKKMGIARYIQKPVKIKQLSFLVREVLDERCASS